uniref:Uncharacterized protein n=1 Tax=Astyanax mexicanus TaxID=7994 RepID=A0A8B9K5P8_ASTMX
MNTFSCVDAADLLSFPLENLQRQKRNWVWNQFFVLEEYTGTDPLYVGKVGSLPHSVP